MNTTEDQDLYSASEVCELVGMTYRQLDYWIRRGIITMQYPAHGSGSHRRWTHGEVVRLKTIVAMYEEALNVLDLFSTGELWRASGGAEPMEESHDTVGSGTTWDASRSARAGAAALRGNRGAGTRHPELRP